MTARRFRRPRNKRVNTIPGALVARASEMLDAGLAASTPDAVLKVVADRSSPFGSQEVEFLQAALACVITGDAVGVAQALKRRHWEGV